MVGVVDDDITVARDRERRSAAARSCAWGFGGGGEVVFLESGKGGAATGKVGSAAEKIGLAGCGG